ncbi:MAG TPA: O-antigen ligase family protein [Micromonosporaceae bacterium]|nr:O-antigen ligase family protein [Micromonosporaceae bacterium]
MSSDQLAMAHASRAGREGRGGGLSALLGTVLLGLVGVLLVEVLFEAWVQHLQGSFTYGPDGRRVITLPEWPKNLKNGLYLTLLALTVVKVAVDRSWRRFLTAADIALAVLGVLMVVAGVLGGSRATLVGEALFVYFRGVIVFYAWRAVNPRWRRVRPLLAVLGAVLVLNSVMALVQMVVGPPAFEEIGWLEMTWSAIYRAHGFVDHPNHLGHLLGVAMLGLLAWSVARPGLPRRWWWLFGLFAVALSATQSREATIGFLAGAVLIGLLRRGRWRPVVATIVVVSLLAAGQLALRPKNRAELQRRLAGVVSAFEVPSGEEGDDYCVEGTVTDTEECINRIPQREIRALYAQQGIRILAGSPLLGFGVGQFGGIVAEKDDPNWNMDPRFGPDGFDMHGSTQKQVDSFWLHLMVEVGLLGLAAYLAWLLLLVLPIVRRLPMRNRLLLGRGPPAAPGVQVHPMAYWAPATLFFAVLVAFLSPALEDPLFPPLLFTVLGLGWVLLSRGELVSPAPPDPDQASSGGAGVGRRADVAEAGLGRAEVAQAGLGAAGAPEAQRPVPDEPAQPEAARPA